MPTVLIYVHASVVFAWSQESAVGVWSVFNAQIYVLSPAVYIIRDDGGS